MPDHLDEHAMNAEEPITATAVDHAIDIEGLHKRYDSAPVLRGLNLIVPPGQVYGLLGPNGAGKSTLIHLLMGFLLPDRGSIKVFGKAPGTQSERIGYLPERLRYHVHYSGREYLRFMGRFSSMPHQQLERRISELLQLVDMEEAADRRMKRYSKGMLQRIGIAQALLSDPELLLIDEPSSGLDPAGQYEIQEILVNLREHGHTIMLCSHQLDEISQICDRVGILVQGQLAAETDLATLPGQSGITITLVELPAEDLDFALRSIDPAISRAGRRITVPEVTPMLQKQVLQLLIEEGFTVASLQPTIGTLRDLYLHVVKGNPPPPEAAPPTNTSLLDSLLATEEDA